MHLTTILLADSIQAQLQCKQCKLWAAALQTVNVLTFQLVARQTHVCALLVCALTPCRAVNFISNSFGRIKCLHKINIQVEPQDKTRRRRRPFAAPQQIPQTVRVQQQ